jgi:hypothetical protein
MHRARFCVGPLAVLFMVTDAGAAPQNGPQTTTAEFQLIQNQPDTKVVRTIRHTPTGGVLAIFETPSPGSSDYQIHIRRWADAGAPAQSTPDIILPAGSTFRNVSFDPQGNAYVVYMRKTNLGGRVAKIPPTGPIAFDIQRGAPSQSVIATGDGQGGAYIASRELASGGGFGKDNGAFVVAKPDGQLLGPFYYSAGDVLTSLYQVAADGSGFAAYGTCGSTPCFARGVLKGPSPKTVLPAVRPQGTGNTITPK